MTPAGTVEVNINSTTAKPSTGVGFGPAVTHPGQRPPLFIAQDEIFFWTAAWQAGERESAAERAAGNSIVFDSDDPQDIIRWLHADDEPDAD